MPTKPITGATNDTDPQTAKHTPTHPYTHAQTPRPTHNNTTVNTAKPAAVRQGHAHHTAA